DVLRAIEGEHGIARHTAGKNGFEAARAHRRAADDTGYVVSASVADGGAERSPARRDVHDVGVVEREAERGFARDDIESGHCAPLTTFQRQPPRLRPSTGR